MQHSHRITSGPLAKFVDFLWLSEGYASTHGAERLLPTGRMNLVLDVSGARAAPGIVSGVSTCAFVLDTSRPLSMMGVCFKAGGGYPFFGLPAGELKDLNVTLDTFWGSDAARLREQLLEAASAAARFRIFERYLLVHLAGALTPSPLVRFAIAQFGDADRLVTVGEVVERTGVSARRFIEEFRGQVGIAPKAFCRIARFRRVIDRIATASAVDWTDTALACGYYDQAHFIHEFREFAGVSPSSYLGCRTGNPNHLLIRQ